VEKTVWSCSLSMSIYLVARLGTVCVLHTRAVPLLFDGLSDSLFRHYLSTARRSPFFRSWKFAVFLDLIFALPGQLSIIAWRISVCPRASSLPPKGVGRVPTPVLINHQIPTSARSTIGYY